MYLKCEVSKKKHGNKVARVIYATKADNVDSHHASSNRGFQNWLCITCTNPKKLAVSIALKSVQLSKWYILAVSQSDSPITLFYSVYDLVVWDRVASNQNIRKQKFILFKNSHKNKTLISFPLIKTKEFEVTSIPTIYI